MKKILIVLVMSSVCWARGGDFVNNGAGLGEKNVLYAYQKLGQYISNCLQSNSCRLSAGQRQLLTLIGQSLPQEIKAEEIIFASEKQSPGFFMIDDQVRIAKTGHEIGSPLHINVDLLYTKNEEGKFEAITVAEAVGLLIHELGHHHGNDSHEFLDLLGNQVVQFLQKKMIQTPVIPWESEISANVFNAGRYASFPELILNVGSDIIDISSIYEKTVRCDVLKIPIPILPIPDIPLITEKPLGSLLFNIHWDKIQESDDTIELKISGNISNACATRDEGKVRNNNSKLLLSFKAVRKGTSWQYVENSVQMKQVQSPWYKIIRIPL